jgi:DNA invertase Pin-like site-specific DNA recombinase
MNDTAPALIYARQSLGNAASIAEQLDLGRKRARTESWAIYATYQDRTSASRYAHAARTDWPKLVDDVQHDRAGIIWLWESSRGERRASTWLALLEDCRDHGVQLYVETHGRLYDMDNPRDWRTLAEDGTDSEYESHKTSERVARSAAARAAAGKVNGRPPYGYLRRYELTDAGKRVLVGQEPHPDEAPIVREIIARIAGGESLRSVAASLNERAVPTKTGAKWSTTQIRGVALNLSYIGKRVHAPGSTRSRAVPGPGAAVYDATWPALVDEPTFYAARRILLDPARTTTRPGKAKHLLSLLATCAVCGGKLTVTYRLREGKRPAYACRDRNCVAIDMADLDSYVTAHVLAALARPRTWKRLVAAGAAGSAELDTARAVLAALQADYDETVRLFQARKISPAAFAAVEPGKLADLEAARKRVGELEAPAPLRFMLDGPADLAARWAAAPVSARRQAIQALVQIAVGKSTSAGHRVPAAKRTRIDWL